MEGEPVGQNKEANVFRRDFTEGPTALNTENGLIIGSSSEWTSQVKDQSTLSTPYPNHDALVLPQLHITSMLSENRGGSIDWRNSLASQAEPFSDRHISGSSNLTFPTCYVWRPPDLLEGQTTQFSAPPNPNALVFPPFQIASTQVLSENDDRRNSLASQVEAFLMGHVSDSSNLAFPAYSDAAAPSQPVATILQTMPMTTHMIPQMGGFSGIFQLEGQLTQSTSHPNPNVVPREPQIASTQMLSENMGSFENWEEFLSLEEETSMGGHVSGSVNLTGTTCCDPSPSQQPVLTNRDMMPTTHVMSHLVAREDMRSVTVKVSYGDRTIKFLVPLSSRIIEVKEEVKKRLKLEPSNFDFEYKDEDDGDRIFLGCDEDLTNHLQLFSNRVIRLLVVDSDASTKNICESCGSLKRRRQ
ncbi:protein NLP6-like [Rhododendron vialii]|uniref:protein NLP6-like n=1 Tax=Rhododendron vialii TaxID=182163 RepID=UPI00265FA657|nr:protein NLP6-like [Rhododendron vialii]